MLPIRDHNPVTRPAILNWIIIGVAALIFLGVQPRDDVQSVRFMYAEATIPCELVTFQPLSQNEVRGSAACSRDALPQVFPDKRLALSVVASLFFHGGIGHLLGNLWVLWIFGNNIEDMLGHVRFLVFYLTAGVAATFAHVVANPTSTVPVVGASGAIAAVMGAYLVLHPRARVTAIVPPLFFIPFRVPSVVFLAFWFFGQFALAGARTNIAWEAHVGGFAVGALYAWRFRRRNRLQDPSDLSM